MTYPGVSTIQYAAKKKQSNLWFSQNQHHKPYALKLMLFIQISVVQFISPILEIKTIWNNINYIVYMTWDRIHQFLTLSLIYS